MKKLIIPILFLLFSFASEAQSWETKLESAKYQTQVNNHLAYTSEVKKTQGLFTDDEFQLILDRCLTKEGVFRLSLSPDKSAITVYFIDWIDQWTINWLFAEGVPDLEHELRIQQEVEFTF